MPVLAYLDPGSGSLILQAVLGGAAGVGVAARAFKQRWDRRRIGSDEPAGDVEPGRHDEESVAVRG